MNIQQTQSVPPKIKKQYPQQVITTMPNKKKDFDTDTQINIKNLQSTSLNLQKDVSALFEQQNNIPEHIQNIETICTQQQQQLSICTNNQKTTAILLKELSKTCSSLKENEAKQQLSIISLKNWLMTITGGSVLALAFLLWYYTHK